MNMKIFYNKVFTGDSLFLKLITSNDIFFLDLIYNIIK